MNRILITCSTDKGGKVLTDILKEMGYVVDSVKSGTAARRKILECEYDLVIIDSPLIDEVGIDLAIQITKGESTTGVIMIVKSENADMISEKVEKYGVFIIPKPFSKPLLYQGVKFVFTSLIRFKKIKENEKKLLKKVEDIRIVDRAKCILIQYNNLTEQDAHRIIEKRSMDDRISKRVVAEKIISDFEGEL